MHSAYALSQAASRVQSLLQSIDTDEFSTVSSSGSAARTTTAAAAAAAAAAASSSGSSTSGALASLEDMIRALDTSSSDKLQVCVCKYNVNYDHSKYKSQPACIQSYV
jgi:hypothetical protein